MSQILADVISKFVPALGAAILGAPGAAIGSAVANLFGGSIDHPEDLAERINQDPEAKLKLLTLHYQLSTAFLGDVQNARQREIELAKAGKKHDWVLPVISLIVMVGFFAVVGVIMFTKLDTSDHDVLYLLVGTLGAAFTQVLNYYLGTSFGEQNKIKMPKV